MRLFVIIVFLISLLLSGQAKAQFFKLPPNIGSPYCESVDGTVSIHAHYDMARVDGCFDLDDGTGTPDLIVTNLAEPDVTNNSPWYGFKVVPSSTDDFNITIRCFNPNTLNCNADRYHPKRSRDGRSWSEIANTSITNSNNDQFTIHFSNETQPFFISAQPITGDVYYNRILEKLGAQPFSSRFQIGTSSNGSPIEAILLSLGQQSKMPNKPTIILTGRQHPPEVTGAIALSEFAYTLIQQDLLAVGFLDNYDVLIIPNMNPDGVADGNWRNNSNNSPLNPAMDLNRDWNDVTGFTQPETAAVKSIIDDIVAENIPIVLFIDFHSTHADKFYIQTNNYHPSTHADFPENWKTAAETVHGSASPYYLDETRASFYNSKRYMRDRFDINAITYEVDDESDISDISSWARAYAIAMTQVLMTW